MSGEGLRGYPNGTNFALDDPRVQELSGCLVAVIEESFIFTKEEPYAF